MKGRGTRKCKETGKDIYKLVDFVDISHLEPLITNETPGVVEEPVEPEQKAIASRERSGGDGHAGEAATEEEEGSHQEMVIADVPVHLVFSETISPEILEQLRQQVEAQLKGGLEREGLKQRFAQTVLCWRYFQKTPQPDHAFMATMGFDLPALRDMYGEPDATLEDFIAVATGETDFGTLRRRHAFERWALEQGLSQAQREMVLMVCDFKTANPDILPEQVLRSHWLDQAGGIPRVRTLFGDVDRLMTLAEDAITAAATVGDGLCEEL
jgi:type I restriction enzyme R subunit